MPWRNNVWAGGLFTPLDLRHDPPSSRLDCPSIEHSGYKRRNPRRALAPHSHSSDSGAAAAAPFAFFHGMGSRALPAPGFPVRS